MTDLVHVLVLVDVVEARADSQRRLRMADRCVSYTLLVSRSIRRAGDPAHVEGVGRLDQRRVRITAQVVTARAWVRIQQLPANGGAEQRLREIGPPSVWWVTSLQ